MSNKLEVDSVILEFGAIRVLQDVYLKSETGRITGLLGRNGSGKSCLMNIIYGKLIPDDYSVRLNGKVQLSSARHPKDIRYLPQFSFIPKSLSLKLIFKDFNLDFSEFVNEFPEFDRFYNSKHKKLSGREQRIVEIYTILMSETKFCMLDEPFSQLMPLHIDKIKSLIVIASKTKGIIITDHLYEHIIDICDDVYVINDGKTHLTNSIENIQNLGYLNLNNN